MGTFVDASAPPQVPPDAVDPPTEGPPQAVLTAARSVHVPSGSEAVAQFAPWQFFWKVRRGALHVTPLGEPQPQVQSAFVVGALVPPSNTGSKPEPQDGAVPDPSQRTSGPVQPARTGGAHVAPPLQPVPESKRGASGTTSASDASLASFALWTSAASRPLAESETTPESP
jgi:hypothetical protein